MTNKLFYLGQKVKHKLTDESMIVVEMDPLPGKAVKYSIRCRRRNSKTGCYELHWFCKEELTVVEK